jgi:hypothetical protein
MPTEIEVIRAALKANPEAHQRLRKMALEGKFGTIEDVPADAPLTVVAATEHGGITGSKQALCACGAAVWLSPSTQATIKARGDVPTPVICGSCFGKAMKEKNEEKRTQ